MNISLDQAHCLALRILGLPDKHLIGAAEPNHTTIKRKRG